MEANQRLRRNLHLLSASNPIDPGPNTAAGHRPDRRAFTAAGKRPDNRPKRSPAAGLGSRILPASVALLGKRIRHHVHRMIHRIDPRQLDR